ncbi:MAG: hypothetical protein L0215_09035 [Gemmataceae bacterium]|nr:hypothetical protein [Gemmataceae bacterium]
MQHDSVIPEPERTTCKYLHRKDLPQFVVEEGIREHAAEFAVFPRLASLNTKTPIERIPYSEQYQWEQNSFDPIVHSIAQYYKVEPRWVLISAFAGGVDGRHSLTHGSLIRHYMDRCGTWTSSYRLVLGLLKEIDVEPQFAAEALVQSQNGAPSDASLLDAVWDVVYVRLSAIQEYGWHAGLEPLMWASDTVNGGLSKMNWSRLQEEFHQHRDAWVHLVIEHAKQHDAFFPAADRNSPIEHEDEG